MIKVTTYNGTDWPIPSAYNKFKFPAGELHVRLNIKKGDLVNILFEFENNEEIIELLLISDAIKRAGGILKKLEIPYVPFARQDRVAEFGEAFSLKVFTDLINTLNAETVVVVDPHSDVTPALLNNVVILPQELVASTMISSIQPEQFWLVSPDGGALKKIGKTAKLVATRTKGVIECSKARNTATGEITGTVVHAENLNGDACVIVDDICDGGRTFIEVAKALKEKGAGKVILIVSHGLFTKGLEVFDGLIDEIYTRKGKVQIPFNPA